MNSKLHIVLWIAAGLLLEACGPFKAPVKTDNATASVSGAQLISDTLYFGMSSLKGPVTEGQWNRFLSEVVTPLFPDGLTVWDAKGQWRGKNGKIGKEKTKVLLLIHPDSPQDDQDIQKIIDAYKKQFDQESVMKARAPADVSF
jgi:hypothetical protein